MHKYSSKNYIKYLLNLHVKYGKIMMRNFTISQCSIGAYRKWFRRDHIAKEGVMFMVEAYNFYQGGYLPKVQPKTNVHEKKDLKTKYKNIVSLNNATPLAIVRPSQAARAYALKVKETSMELGEATNEAIQEQSNVAPFTKSENLEKDISKVVDLFNELLLRSDEYGKKNNRPSRPGGELRNLVYLNKEEIEQSGLSIDEQGFLSISKDADDLKVPENFFENLSNKCDEMSMNPMEFVDKKIYSYAHLHQNDIGSSYESSIYTGMMFNSYC